MRVGCFFFKRMDVCIGGLLLEMRVVCYSLMHQHSAHLDLNPTGKSKTHNTDTHTHWGLNSGCVAKCRFMNGRKFSCIFFSVSLKTKLISGAEVTQSVIDFSHI